MEKSESEHVALIAPSEADLWKKQEPTASSALTFVVDFLGLRMGPANDKLLTPTAKGRLTDIMRAVSIVESRHGTQGAQQPARDPVQCGNPADVWWEELTGQTPPPVDRLVRGPGLSNLDANAVPAAAEATAGFPTGASMSKLGVIASGHRDPNFSPVHSYLWGLVYLIHRINTTAGDKTYQCRALERDRLIDGAETYNGNGDPAYRQKIVAALTEFSGLTTAALQIRTSHKRKPKSPASRKKPASRNSKAEPTT